MNNEKNNKTLLITVVGILVLSLILVIGTLWMGRSAREDTQKAVRSVSLLYLDELAGRREQVVEDSLNNDIDKIGVAINLLTEEDLQDKEHLEAFQRKMKAFFDLEKRHFNGFFFVLGNILFCDSLFFCQCLFLLLELMC